MADTKNVEAVGGESKTIIYWDDQHIEQESLLLPEALRAPYRMVKLRCRESFNGDMDLVTEAFAKVGATRDKTTWTRVFKRGRLTHDAAGNTLPSPLVSFKNLGEDFTAFLTQTRVELQRGRMPFIETEIWSLISRYVAKKMRPEWVNKFGLVIGPTGLQKSACYRELANRDPNIKHGECGENGSLHQLITLFAKKIGVGVNRSHDEKRFKIYEWFGPGKCIIPDNTQDLQATTGSNEERHKAFKFFRWLQDERGGTVIWSITPMDETKMFPKDDGFMEQFEGRTGGLDGVLRLPDKNPKNDLVLIAETLGLKNARQHEKTLLEIGVLRGRIRPYFEILQQAKFAADADRKPLTIDYIEEAMEDRRPASETKK